MESINYLLFPLNTIIKKQLLIAIRDCQRIHKIKKIQYLLNANNMRPDKMTYLEFHTSLMGFDIHEKKSGSIVYRWELFIRNFTIDKIKDKFNLVEKVR